MGRDLMGKDRRGEGEKRKGERRKIGRDLSCRFVRVSALRVVLA
jgi:hypothetical protein